jgi:putative oxidoreductase
MIAKIQALYRLFLKIADSLQSPVLLLVRLDFGYQFFESGWAHLHTMPKFIEFLTGLGIPAPTLNAYFVAVLETVGGILLMLGLGSRLFSLLLAGDMIVAFITADSEALRSIFSSDPDKFFNAAPHNLLFISLVVLAFGPGKFALDTLLASWWKNRRPLASAATV